MPDYFLPGKHLRLDELSSHFLHFGFVRIKQTTNMLISFRGAGRQILLRLPG